MNNNKDMKTKKSYILILFLVFLISSLFLLNHAKFHEYEVLKVIEADKFYVDINKNDKIDDNELLKVKDIVAYSPYYEASKTKNTYADITQWLKNGYLAYNWAKDNIEGKIIKAKNLKHCKLKDGICYSDIYFQDENYAEILLKNGLAYLPYNIKRQEYFFFLNKKQAENNAKTISSLDFVVINLKNGIVHKINCEYASKIAKLKLELKNKIKNHDFCKICFNSQEVKKYSTKFNIPKSQNEYKKSQYRTFDDIDIYLINPLEYNKPNYGCVTKFCKRLIKEINSSNKTIDIALYGIGEQEEVISALKNAQNRGVKIRCVFDSSKGMNNVYSKTMSFANEFNCVFDDSEKIMHNKFFVFDKKLVLTGSSNISATGSGGYNSNIALFVNDSKIAESYTKEFEQMYKGKFSNNKPDKITYIFKDNEVYFLPNNKVYEDVLLKAVKNSRKAIYLSAFYLTDYVLIDELIKAKKRNVEVLIILDALSSKNFSKQLFKLRENNIPIIVENWGGKNHEKTIMIDFEKLIVGSCNFSKSGFHKNDENLIIIKNEKLAQFYADYFLYLFNSIDFKFLTKIPKAEGLDSYNSCFDGIDNDYDGKIDTEEEACKMGN